MLKIAITGASGLLGSRIIELLKNEFTFLPISQETTNITDKGQVSKTLHGMDYDILLHLAAYTNVDGAEKEEQLARRVNVEGTRNLFETNQKKKRKFIYISTDFVFDGTEPPYNEESLPHPISVYGQTKYEGEQIVQGGAMIIRLSYPYRKHFPLKKDFVRSILAYLHEGKPLSMITDSVITPTFIDDIAYGLKHLCTHYTPTVYHLVGADSLSPYDAGKAIAEAFSLNKDLIRKTTYEQYFAGRAKRPRLSVIQSTKNTFYPMKSFAEGLNFLYDVTL